MTNIRKAFNLKVILIAISIIFLCNATLYSYPDSKDSLRVPLGRYDRVIGAMDSSRQRNDRGGPKDRDDDNVKRQLETFRLMGGGSCSVDYYSGYPIQLTLSEGEELVLYRYEDIDEKLRRRLAFHEYYNRKRHSREHP